jgi:hypothetical protein
LVRKKSARWLHPPWLCSPSARHPRPCPRSLFSQLATATVSSGHTPTSPPRATPPPPASRVAPLQSPRNHASPSTEKRSRRHLPPNPSRRRLTYSPPSSERHRRCSSPQAFLRASDPERCLLLRSSSAPPIQGKQQIQVGASPFTSPCDLWSVGVPLLPIFRGAEVDHAADTEPHLLLRRSSVPPI